MNPGQMAQQIKHALEQAVWPGDDGEAVFGTHGNVVVFAGTPSDEQRPPGVPFAYVGIDSGAIDPDAPDLILQQFTIATVAVVGGDQLGESAIIGGAAQTLNRSAGRGVAEVSARVREAVANLTGADGAHVILSGTSTSRPTTWGPGLHGAVEELTLTAVCTSHPFFAPPQRMRWEAGKWKWHGAHCSSRFDFVQFRVMRKPGESPSVDTSDGTVIYSGQETEFTGTQADGQTYTCFAEYSGRQNANLDGISSPETGSYRVV